MEPKALALWWASIAVALATTPEPPVTTTTPSGSSSSSWSSSSTTEKTVDKETTTTTTTSTLRPPTTSGSGHSGRVVDEWRDMDEEESEKLVNFVVSEIQKLKVEHKELDECQELNLSSVLSGKKLSGKVTKYSVTLKVQPQMKNTEICLQQNSTLNNMHPEICEADVTEGDHGGTEGGKTLLRSTCLQVEELQD